MLTQVILATLISNPAAPSELHARVEKAVLTGDTETLTQLQRDLQTKNESAYLQAYVSWRLNHALRAKPSHDGEIERLLQAARVQLERRLKSNPDDGEAQVLLASVLGELIASDGSRARDMGPRSSALMQKAKASAPNSPRVALLQGIWYLFMPAMYGGGLDRAANELDHAIALFEKEPDTAPWPNWGRADVYAWRGQVALKQGSKADAKAFFERGLAEAPNSAWIRKGLLPAVQ